MFRSISLLAVLVLCTACVSTNVGTELNGMTDNDGEDFVHQETNLIGLHWVFGALGPAIGDASFENAVNEFSAAASADGRSQSRITTSETSNWWWVFPPFSFILTPITSRVGGDVK